MLLKDAAGWSADPVTRYADGAILRTKSNYTNPQVLLGLGLGLGLG